MNNLSLNYKSLNSKPALKISLVYAVFSLLWIIFSDTLLLFFVKNPELLTQIQIVKGWFFVIVSAMIIYFLLLREMRHVQQSQKKYLEIFNTTTEALFISDAETGKILDVNQAATDLFGFSYEELTARSINDLNLNIEQNTSKKTHLKQTRNNNHDLIWVDIVKQDIHDEMGAQKIIAVRDITIRKRSEDVLRTLAESGSIYSGDIFKTIVRQLALVHNVRYVMIASLHSIDKNTATTLAIWDDNGYAENFSYALKGTPCQNVLTQTSSRHYPSNAQQQFPEDSILVDLNVQGYFGVPLLNSHDEAIGVLALLDDKPLEVPFGAIELLNSLATRASLEIERKAVDEKLKLSSRVFSETHEGIIITDVTGTIVDVNPAFCNVTEYSREDVIGEKPGILNSGKQGPEFYKKMWQTLATQGHWQGEVWNRKKGGALYAELLTVSSLYNDEGDIINYVGIFTDITHSKKQQEQLEFIAHYDVLTKLPNRILFADRFNQAIAHCKRTETLLAVCFLDLDDFKPINDTYGHLVGDQILIEVAERIQSNIREEDTVSRQGGDEFTIFLVNLETPFEGELMLDRIQHALAQPYLIDDHVIAMTSSMGVTLYPLDDFDLDTLLRHADQAMYQAKMAGKSSYHIFNVEHDQETTKKHLRLNEVIQAFEQNQLCLYFQPKVNMKTGQVVGAEGLLRWIHPENGLIPPLKFLPVIEDSDFEITLGNWIIEQALEQLQQWNKEGFKLDVSINISSQHLQSPDFFAVLDKALTQHPDVNSNHFQLEILESSVLGDVNHIRTIIKTCRDKLGVQFALDDFGTGYSSLTHLRNLPANTIKIDQSFVRDMLSDQNDFAIIDGTIGLANSFSREIIAEGVETTEHGLMLLVMGCELAQGYGIARPMPAHDLSDWINSYQANQTWIDCANNNQTVPKQKLKLLRLILQHWHIHIKDILNPETSNEGILPILNPEKCHCNAWIKREEREQTFAASWLNELDQAHKKSHLIAHDLFHNPDMESAAKNQHLDDLQLCFDHINHLLDEQNKLH